MDETENAFFSGICPPCQNFRVSEAFVAIWTGHPGAQVTVSAILNVVGAAIVASIRPVLPVFLRTKMVWFDMILVLDLPLIPVDFRDPRIVQRLDCPG